MNRLTQGLAAFALMAVSATAAFAQVPGGLPIPDLQNRIPAPLPPPPPPPVINGPLSQAPQPGVYQPPRLDTRQDRAVRCVHEGSQAGLRGGKLDAYARRCAD